MPVDYKIPTQLQNSPVNFPSPPPSNAEIVPYKPSPPLAPQQVNSPPTPQQIRDLPSPNPTNNKTPEDYRTIDLKKDSLTGSYRAPRQDPLVNPNNGVSFGRYPNGVSEVDVEGTAAIGKFVVGAVDQLRDNPNYERRERQREVFTPLENLSYDLGKNFAQGLQRGTSSATESAQKILDDLWRNRPQFEIPQPKIDFKIPEIPQINFPEFPEFKFPEISFPQPKPPIPQPKPRPKAQRGTLTDKVRDLEPVDCGGVTLGIARIRKVWQPIITTNSDGSTNTTPYFTDSSVEEWLNTRRLDPDVSNYPDVSLLEGAGGIGILLKGDRYTYFPLIGQSCNMDGSGRGELRYPYLQSSVARIGIFNRKSPGEVLNDFSGWEVYFFETASPDKDGCFIPQPEPSSPPSPPDCCMCCPNQNQEKIDYARIKRIMQDTLKEQKFNIDVPICKCEFNEVKGEWEPKIENKSLIFFASTKEQAEQQAVLHFENAKQLADMCVSRNKTDEAVAAIPLSWQIRNEGKTSQLVIQCAVQEKDAKGKLKYGSAKYPITVPHWTGNQNTKPKLPLYSKGNYEGILVLADNSRVTINASNQAECTKILNSLRPFIKKEMLEGSYFKGGMLNTKIKIQKVKPMYGRYFSTGQRNNKPDWRVDFP